MPWSLLFGFLGRFSEPLANYFKAKQDAVIAKVEAEKQIELARAANAAELVIADTAKARDVLGATGAWFKYTTYMLWFVPFVLSALGLPLAQQIFINLQGLPEWYVTTCVTLQLTVWGIAIGAPVVGTIFTRLGSFFDARREAKLPAKMFYEVLRSVKGNITQAEVDAYELALKSINKD